MAKKRGKGPNFWSWLAANTSRIQAADDGAIEEISEQLERDYPDLKWEITVNESGPWDFCVTADGIPELFEQVQAIVASAPPIPGWEIKAFRQRGSLDAVIEMDGRSLGYDDIWCNVSPDGDRARVTLLVRGLTLKTAEELLGAALVLLDNAVGEYDAVVKILELDNGPLPKNPIRSESLFPLSELPGYLDALGDGAH